MARTPEPVEVFEAELQVDQMVALPGQRHAIAEEVGRGLRCGGEDLRDIAIGHFQLGLGVGVVGNRHQTLAFPPFASERVEVLVPLKLELRTVERSGGRVGEAWEEGGAVAREEGSAAGGGLRDVEMN